MKHALEYGFDDEAILKKLQEKIICLPLKRAEAYLAEYKGQFAGYVEDFCSIAKAIFLGNMPWQFDIGNLDQHYAKLFFYRC